MHKFLKAAPAPGPSPPKRARLDEAPEPPSIAEQHAFLDLSKKREWSAIRTNLAVSPGLINVQPLGRWSVLHQASEAGNAEAVTFLLEQKADMNSKTKDGRTPQELAKLDSIRALFLGAVGPASSGSSAGGRSSPVVAKEDVKSTTASAVAKAVAFSSAPDTPGSAAAVVPAMVPSIAEQHAFLDLSKKKEWSAIRTSLAASPGLLNVQPLGRWSVLHQASEAGNAEAVAFLLEQKADTNSKTNDGRTPLELAKLDSIRALFLSAVGPASSGSSAGTPGSAALVVPTIAKDAAALVWQIQPEALPGKWVDMGKERQALLNDAKAASIPKAMFRESGHSYIVDLDGCTQTDFASGQARRPSKGRAGNTRCNS